MAIAILGWGSLIWSPGCLRLKTLRHDDGPELPIEFARKSRDKRLTLVICEKASPVRVYWALSEFDDPSKARENLGERERSGKRGIQSTCDKPPFNQGITNAVSAWMRSQNSIGGVGKLVEK